MDRTKNNAFVQTWGDLDFKSAPLSDLFSAIDKKLGNGADINALGLSQSNEKKGVFTNEEYTLTDWVIQQKLASHGFDEYERWDKMMSYLRKKGAKPACALKKKISPEQKILNELSYLKKRESVLVKSLKQYRNR
ncbi:MAG: hypothetical protein E7021_05500 [Alphaproteobacteria bacterium]|nr:hypothetical protein [Alphaproteobacteria bacterium]